MAEFPSLPLFTDAWIADTKHLSRLERGTYHDLLVLMWRTPECRVPNDDAWLGKRLGMTLEEVRAELRPVISEFCQSDGNYVVQKRLRKEWQWCRRNSKKQSVNAKARWNKEKDTCQPDANTTPVGNAPTPIPTYSKNDDADDARERPPLIRPEAIRLADEIAALCGHDLRFVPPEWHGAPMRVETWLAAEWPREIILAAVKGALAKKRGPPPNSINYFEKPIAEAVAKSAVPLPKVVVDNTPEVVNVRLAADRSATAAAHRLVERIREWDAPTGGGEGGGDVARLLPPGRCGGP